MGSKKGQAWGTDLTFGFLIFSMGIIIFFVYAINYTSESKENFEIMLYEGENIVQSILSEGSPVNWNETTVTSIGILNDGKINETKLELFYNFTQSNYSTSKTIFDSSYDYYFFLDNNFTINSVEVDGVGNPSVDRNSISATNLIKITKLTIYKDKPVTAYLYVWDE